MPMATADARTNGEQVWPRRLAFGVLFLAIAVVALEWMGWPFLRKPLQSQLQAALGRGVRIGEDFGVRFLGSLRAHTDLLFIGAAGDGPQRDGKAPDLLRATDLRVAVPYSTVFALVKGSKDEAGTGPFAPSVQRPYVTTLEATRLDATLLRDKDGNANWRFSRKTPQDEVETPVLPGFGRLAIDEGKIVIDDAISQLDVMAAVRTLEGSASNAQSGTSASDATPGLQVVAEGRYRHQPLSIKLHASSLLAIADPSAKSSPPWDSAPISLRIELRAGRNALDFSGSARDPLHFGALDGDFRLAGQSLAAVGGVLGVTLPTTNSFEMRGHVVREGEIWRADVAALTIGESRLSGSFRYDPTLPVPKLTGRLAGQRLAIVDLGPALGTEPQKNARPASNSNTQAKVVEVTSAPLPAPASADSTAEAKRMGARLTTDGKAGREGRENGAKRGGKSGTADKKIEESSTESSAKNGSSTAPPRRVLPQRDFDLPSLAAMDADVSVDLDEFDLGTSELDDFSPFRTHILLDDQTLRIEEIVARAADGELRGRIVLDAKPKQPLWTADLRWSGIHLAKFVKAGEVSEQTSTDAEKAKQPGNPPNGYLSGTLGGQLKVRGSGRSTAAMLATLDGSAQLWVRDGAISHLLVEAVGLDLAQALGLLIVGDDPLPMRCAVAAFEATQGSVVPRVAVIDTTDSTVQASGVISLADERLQLELKTRPKDISPAALRTPVIVEGTFANPEVRLEKSSIGVRLVAAAALAAITPVAALLALIDVGEPEKEACADAIGRAMKAPTPRRK